MPTKHDVPFFYLALELRHQHGAPSRLGQDDDFGPYP